jgi:predicted deacylase
MQKTSFTPTASELGKLLKEAASQGRVVIVPAADAPDLMASQRNESALVATCRLLFGLTRRSPSIREIAAALSRRQD